MHKTQLLRFATINFSSFQIRPSESSSRNFQKFWGEVFHSKPLHFLHRYTLAPLLALLPTSILSPPFTPQPNCFILLGTVQNCQELSHTVLKYYYISQCRNIFVHLITDININTIQIFFIFSYIQPLAPYKEHIGKYIGFRDFLTQNVENDGECSFSPLEGVLPLSVCHSTLDLCHQGAILCHSSGILCQYIPNLCHNILTLCHHFWDLCQKSMKK